jgi:hypothetical protein
MIQLAGFIFAVGFYSLLSKVRLGHNWHSFLMKCDVICRDTYIYKIIATGVHRIHT